MRTYASDGFPMTECVLRLATVVTTIQTPPTTGVASLAALRRASDAVGKELPHRGGAGGGGYPDARYGASSDGDSPLLPSARSPRPSICSTTFEIVRSIVDTRRNGFERSPRVDSRRPAPWARRSSSWRSDLLVALVIAHPGELLIVLALYVPITLAYVYWIKNVAIVELGAVASGFFLRAYAGAAASHIPVSTWFLVVISFGALFLVVGKRASE